MPAGLRFTRCRYLTARCPTGCESWLHPRAVEGHLQPGRCSGRAWVDSVEDSALVPESAAAIFTERLPPGLVGPVDVSQDRLRLTSTPRLHADVVHGIVVRSPIQGVSARRWVYVVRAATDGRGPHAIEKAVTPGGFAELERELNAHAWLVDCPDCGQTVKRSRITLHRASSTMCRWQRARTEVRALWVRGYRDPFSMPAAPLSWEALQRTKTWRSRVRTIEFPRWVAVMVSPANLGAARFDEG